MRKRTGLDPVGRRGLEELGGFGVGKTKIRIHGKEKHIFSIKEKRNEEEKKKNFMQFSKLFHCE